MHPLTGYTDKEKLDAANRIITLLIKQLGGEVIISDREIEEAYLNMVKDSNWNLYSFPCNGGLCIRVVKERKSE